VTSPLPFRPAPLLDEHFDHELAQLDLGLRQVIKREFCRDEELTHMRARGWIVARIEGGYQIGANSADIQHDKGGHHTVFIGAPEAVTAACALESVERTGRGQARHDAMVEIGTLLGYPTCCTRAYLTQAEQGESASFGRLFKVGPHREAQAGNNLFVLSHALISHFPCALDCQRSAALARATWSRLAEQSPDRANAVAQLLGAPITVWDRYRFLVEHPIHGPLAPHQIDGHPLLLTHDPLGDFVRSLPTAPPGGTRFEFLPM
jgi:hypothetical protein